MADVAGLGVTEIKAMRDDGYDPGYVAAITAAAARRSTKMEMGYLARTRSTTLTTMEICCLASCN